MKSIARLCVAAAVACLIAPSASADGLYLRLAGGGGHVDEDSFGGVDFEFGYVGSAALGYNWFFPRSIADLRLEIEGSYRYNDVDEVAGISADGDVQVWSAMLNGYFDFRTNWPVVPYVGLGFGASRIALDEDGGGVFSPIDDHDTVFAYQVMGGINLDLSDNLAVGVEYRFLDTESFSLEPDSGGTFSDDYNHHSLLLTLIIGF